MHAAKDARWWGAVALAIALAGCGGGGDGILSGLVGGQDTNPIPLPDAAVPGANYPSTITITTPKTQVTYVIVAVTLTHDRPRDVDLLLVGPTGQTCLLMADCFDATPFAGNVLQFTSQATVDAPNTTQPPPPDAGPYRATDYDPPGDVDAFPGAPAGPYGATLTAFVGTNPNGDWRLFAIDDEAGGVGTQVDSWAILLTAE